MDKEKYEKDLRNKQEKHLNDVKQKRNIKWKPCLHEQCSNCHGTGVKIDGQPLYTFYKLFLP